MNESKETIINNSLLNILIQLNEHPFHTLSPIITDLIQQKNKLTVDFVTFVDLEAFKNAIDHIINDNKSVGYRYLFYKEHKNSFVVWFYREAYDTNGFHVGSECFEFKYKIYNKGEFKSRGHIAKILDRSIIPDVCAVKVKAAARENKYYMKSDDDFASQEYECILEEIMKNIPDMKFHHNEGEGGYWEMRDNKYYV